MEMPKFTDDERKPGIHKMGEIILDGRGRLEHAVHVNAKDRIPEGVRIENTRSIVPHHQLPVLAPVGSIDHEHVREARTAQGQDGVLRSVDPG